MDARKLQWIVLFVLGIASAASYAAAAEPLILPAPEALPLDAKKQESMRAPVQPAPAESRTVEEASKRAADPKDPSGALIVAPPAARSPGPAR